MEGHLSSAMMVLTTVAAPTTAATANDAHVARRCMGGANREMLGQAIGHVRGLQGTAAQKAELFQQLAGQITELSKGNWTAARAVGTEGSHVFLGSAGEALVINPAGQLFRGSLQTGGFASR